MDTKQKIARDLTIDSIFTLFPQHSQRLASEMTKAGLQCVGCGASTTESLEEGMRIHGMSEEKIDKLIARLNDILEEELDLSTVTLTPRAASKFLSVLESEDKQGWALRLEEKKAGCSGFEYILDFSEKAEENDDVLVSEGIEIHINKDSTPRLLGSIVDYVETLQNSGFKVSNPNVKKSCGCGTSHSY